MASKKKPGKKSAKGKAPPPQTPPDLQLARRGNLVPEAPRVQSPPDGDLHDPGATTRSSALLAEFKNPDQKFKVLMVKGSPFVSLSISPTRGGND